jgi:hypothetical protein
MILRRDGTAILKNNQGKRLICVRNLTVENTKTGEVIQDDADVLLSARGSLNDIAWPKIPGLETFKGEVMHSASWNQKFVPHLMSLINDKF